MMDGKEMSGRGSLDRLRGLGYLKNSEHPFQVASLSHNRLPEKGKLFQAIRLA
ncbi:hypothetical protein [Eikenella longinqua]|uniref:hypothetical protein n=1 Tax=Eikenella longinqua TaxID=1795827 RepID=UPI0012E70AC4|nr:hypothetical protein [Eikenella longinqua]